MRIVIRTSGDWPPAAIELVRKRLEFALGRFTGRGDELAPPADGASLEVGAPY